MDFGNTTSVHACVHVCLSPSTVEDSFFCNDVIDIHECTDQQYCVTAIYQKLLPNSFISISESITFHLQ